MIFASRSLFGLSLLSALSIAVAAPPTTAAQTGGTSVFRARVTDFLDVPRPGVLVIASRPTDGSEVARAVTNEEGHLTFRVASRELRLRVLSIGHQPSDIGIVQVPTDGSIVTVRVEFQPITLPAIVARETARCSDLSAGSVAAILLAEARKAILLSVSVPAGTPPRATIARFAYWTNSDGSGRRAVTVSQTTGASLRPFQSVPRALLDAEGYVVDEPDGSVYRAPDVSIFADDRFARDNCFRLIEADTSGSALVGIGFEPQGRSRLVRVAGVLWVDSTDFRLSHVDFRYVGLDRVRAAAGAGGSIRFSKLPDGLWFEERWELRMPQLQTTLSSPDARVGQQTSTVVQGVRVIGGQVLRLQVGDDLRFAASDSDLDSLAGFDVAPAQIDSTNADVESSTIVSGSCVVSSDSSSRSNPSDVSSEPTAELIGRVVGAPADIGVKVTAEWRERFRQEGTHQWRWTNRVAESITTPGGEFTFCAIPQNRPVTIRASHESSRAGPLLIRIASGDEVARVELRLTSSVAAAGQRIIRVATADGMPVPYATVALDGGVAFPTGADGSLRLRVRSGAAVRVVARRIGFVPVDTMVSADGSADIAVEMRPVAQTLESVVVRADPTPLERAGFYDRAERVRRGAFTADFLTPEHLDQRNSSLVSQQLQLSRFITLALSREPRPRRVARGRGGCKMEVLVDGKRLNVERTLDRQEVPIDDLLSGTEVAAIEVYPSIANAPAELIPLTGRGECGLIAIWTGGRG